MQIRERLLFCLWIIIEYFLHDKEKLEPNLLFVYILRFWRRKLNFVAYKRSQFHLSLLLFISVENIQGRQSIRTYNIFIAKASKLCQFLAHQEFSLSNGCKDTFSDIIWNSIVSKIFFKITDLFFKFENFILQDL